MSDFATKSRYYKIFWRNVAQCLLTRKITICLIRLRAPGRRTLPALAARPSLSIRTERIIYAYANNSFHIRTVLLSGLLRTFPVCDRFYWQSDSSKID